MPANFAFWSEISSYDWYIKTLVNITRLFSWTTIGWKDATGHKSSEYFCFLLTCFSVVCFQFFVSSISVLIMWSLCFFLQPEWLSGSTACLEVCDCMFLSLLTYSASKFLASLIKGWTIHSPCTPVITALFLLSLLSASPRDSPRNFNHTLNKHSTRCSLQKNRITEFHFASLLLISKPFLIFFFLFFFTASICPEWMSVNGFSETRDGVTAEKTTSEFHRWQFILNTLKGT